MKISMDVYNTQAGWGHVTFHVHGLLICAKLRQVFLHIIVS